MKNKKLLLLAALMAAGTMMISGCDLLNDRPKVEGEIVNITAEYGVEFDFTQYFKDGDTLANAKLIAPDGSQEGIGNGVGVLQQVGEYKFYLASGDCVVIAVSDTKGPLMSHSVLDKYYVGEPITLSIYSIDAYDGQVPLTSLTVKFGETEIPVQDMTFMPEQEGTYTVSCTAKDSFGNETSYSFNLEAEIYYPPAYGAHSIVMDSASEATDSIGFTQEDVIVDGMRYNKSIASSDVASGWAGLTLSGSGLKALTAYDIVVEYEASNVTDPNFAFIAYNNRQSSEVRAAAGVGAGSFTVRVTTNSKGEYYWSCPNSVWVTTGGSEIFWKSITAVEKETYQSIESYAFGKNTLTITNNGSVQEFINTAVTDAEHGEYFKTVNLGAYGFARLVFSGAGLKPETEYKVTLKYGGKDTTDPNFKFLLMADDKATPTGYGWQSTDTLEFLVTTDADGAYYVAHQLMLMERCELHWYSITEEENIKVNYNVQVIVKGVDVTSTLDASITTRKGVPGTTVDITEDAEAMLLTNAALVNCYLDEEESILSGVVAEDGSLVLKVVYNERTAADKGSIYGTGITVTATSETGKVSIKRFEEGENAGYTRTYVKFLGGNYGTLAVRADASAGLKANTTYIVLLTVELDGNFPAFFDDDASSFILAQPSGVITVEVTTNENGQLEWVDRVYYNEGSYVDFVGVSITEKVVDPGPSVEVIGSVYGTGVTVTGTGGAVSVESKVYTEGEKAGYTRTYFTYNYCDPGTFTVAADASAGLKANTTYEVTVTYEMDAEFPAIFNKDVTFSLSKSEGVLTFDVTTDANGAFNQTWSGIVWNAGTYLDVVGVSIAEKVEEKGSVYGTGVIVTGTGSAVGVESKAYTEGEKAGYTRTYFTYSYCDPGTFTVAADASAGLKANTTYEVTVTYEMDADEFGIFTGDLSFYLRSSVGVLTFDITTDENGAFNQTWSGIVWNAGTYLDVVGVSFAEKVKSVYGTGITVTATSETGVVEVKAFEDGENAGYTRTYVSYVGGNYGTLAVRADASAGLKANTSYKVLLTVEVDGNFPAFFDHDANFFIIGQPGGVITVDVMTNENGELEWVDRVYYNEGSYVDFVSVAIVENRGSAYGTGVTVTGTGSAVTAESKLYTEGEKAGYTRTYFTYSYCDPGTFTVAADASAGLKANTTYEVTVTYEMDAEFPAIFNADVTFSLSKSEGVLTFDVTTDANGAFNQTWSGIVWNAGSYLDVVGVSFQEMIENQEE